MQITSAQIKQMTRSEFIYCQQEMLGNKRCDSQCDHCEEFYKPQENVFGT